MPKTPEEMKQEAQLAEYKALRDEILNQSRVENQFVVLTTTISMALLGVAVNTGNPWVAILVPVFVLVSLVYVRSRTRGIATIGAYIAVWLDDEIDGLNWESTVVRPPRSVKRKRQWWSSSALLFLYILLLIAGAGTFVLLYLEECASPPTREQTWKLGMAIAASIVIAAYCCVFYYSDRGAFDEKYQEEEDFRQRFIEWKESQKKSV